MSHRHRRRTVAAQLATSLTLGVAAVLVATGGTGPAQAASVGSDAWGPQGRIATTESAVTVHWDNSAATPVEDRVPRTDD